MTSILQQIYRMQISQPLEISRLQIQSIKDHIFLQTLLNDRNEDHKSDAITEIYKVLRPGEPPTIEIASTNFQ